MHAESIGHISNRELLQTVDSAGTRNLCRFAYPLMLLILNSYGFIRTNPKWLAPRQLNPTDRAGVMGGAEDAVPNRWNCGTPFDQLFVASSYFLACPVLAQVDQ
jgi:hypothetical protein